MSPEFEYPLYGQEPSPEDLFEGHLETGEPLDADQCQQVVDAGLAQADQFENRGGGLHWLLAAFPDGATEPTEVRPGEPCPKCGGTIVVDGVIHYVDVPLTRDGTDLDGGDRGDFEWESPSHCKACGLVVLVEG